MEEPSIVASEKSDKAEKSDKSDKADKVNLAIIGDISPGLLKQLTGKDTSEKPNTDKSQIKLTKENTSTKSSDKSSALLKAQAKKEKAKKGRKAAKLRQKIQNQKTHSLMTKLAKGNKNKNKRNATSNDNDAQNSILAKYGNIIENTEGSTSDIVDAKGVKLGQIEDVNPIVIGDYDKFREILSKISDFELDDEEKDLIDRCVLFSTTEEEDEADFNPGDFFTFVSIARKNPKHSNEIFACSNFLSNNIDFEGTLPKNIFLKTSMTYGAYDDLLLAGAKLTDKLEKGEAISDDESEVTDESSESSESEDNLSEPLVTIPDDKL